MDTTQEYNTAQAKIASGSPVNYRDIAVCIANDEPRLLKYMSDNDPVQVYRLIHESDAPMLIGKNASFQPNANRVDGELHLLLIKKDWKTLNQILTGFRINPNPDNYTTNQKIIESLVDIGAISMTPDGYQFNLQLK